MTDFTTPQLVVTDVGLAAASQATPVGPFVHITGFRIGSAYGYNPLPIDTNINGDLLYQGVPTSYRYIGNNTLAVICEMPATVGPFQFGEVAIDLDGGVMFAKAVFAEPQTKFTSLNTNVLSTYTFNCLIKLAQSVAIFQVNTLCGPPDILEIDAWTDVLPPYLGGTTSLTPALIVKEQDPYGEATMIFQTSDHHWSVGGPYDLFYAGPCQPSSNLSVTVLVADILARDPSLFPGDFATGVARDFIVQDNQGYFRAVSGTILTVGAGDYMTLTFTSPWPYTIPTGSDVFIYTVKPMSHARLSSDSGNLIEKRPNGLYYGITAPPNLQEVYVDAVNGNDSTGDGTRANPWRTIKFAVDQGAQGLNRTLRLYEQQTHYVDPNNIAVFRGGNWSVLPYGPLSDGLPPNPGDSPFMTAAAQYVAPTIQALNFRRSSNGAGGYIQFADALVGDFGANIIYIDIKFVCGARDPAGPADPISNNGSFHHPYGTGSMFIRNSEIYAPSSESSFASNYIVNRYQVQVQAVSITGPGRLFSADNTAMTFSFRPEIIGSRGMTAAATLAYIGNKGSGAPLFYNFDTNLTPNSGGGGGTLTRVDVPASSYTMPADRIGFYQVAIDDHTSGDRLNRFMYVNGAFITTLDAAPDCGFLSGIPLNPGDNVQILGDIGSTTNTRTFVLMYPPGITTWN